MTIAQKLRAVINERGTTYTFISQKTGIPVDAISKSLLGKRRLQADELIAICKALNIGLDLLLDADTNQSA